MVEPNENDPPRNRPWDRGGDGDRDDTDQRRRYDDEDDFDRPRRGSGPQPTNGLATAAMILGILAVCTGPLLGIPALICGAVALGRPGGRGAAIAGLVLGGFGAILLPVLLLPAVFKVREAASRMKDAGSLKQIGLAVHNYHDTRMQLPPADEKLSWRVYILPYIEQDNLYRQFNMKQPWDGPANRRFASERVSQYVSAADPPETPETRFRVFVGPGTLYEPGKPPPELGEVKGAAHTFFAVEAAETVPWTQPKELAYDRNGPLPALGAPGRSVVQVLMLDGSVRSFSTKTSADVIRVGIEPAEGKIFNP